MIGLVAIIAFPGGAKNLNLSAKLSEIAGIVEVRNSVQENYNLVNDGYTLNMVQQLQTQQQSKVRLDLSTGSIVRLGQSTIFSLAQTQDASSSGLSLLTMQLGKMWIVLKGGSIDVNTPGGLASVRGSYISVWVDPDTNFITVMCLEGHCNFTNNAGTVELTSAQKVISIDPNILPVVQPMDMSDIQSWLDNCPE
ncbi:MAG: FecR domain-containing protein, partial [Anaerolineales bacterium]